MNEELLALYTADHQERIDQPRMGTPEYMAMRERDHQRRLRAAAILSTLASPAAADLYHAALLFQHRMDSRKILLATTTTVKQITRESLFLTPSCSRALPKTL